MANVYHGVCTQNVLLFSVAATTSTVHNNWSLPSPVGVAGGGEGAGEIERVPGQSRGLWTDL